MDQNEERERCEICKFWSIEAAQSSKLIPTERSISIGVCLRYPPAMLQGLNETSRGIEESLLFFQPRTRLNNWCGEFRPKTEQDVIGG